jgi:hypothetical protein
MPNRNETTVRSKSEVAATIAGPGVKEKRKANAAPAAIAANGIIRGSRARKPFSLMKNEKSQRQTLGGMKRISDGRPNASPRRTARMLQPRQYNEGLMRPVIRIQPTLRNNGVKKIRHQAVRVDIPDYLLFQHTGSLEFSDALQLISR